MFRHNLSVCSVCILAAFNTRVMAEETIELSSVGAPVSQVRILDFTFTGTTLTFPNGQTVKKVTGVQVCDTSVLVVSHQGIGVYNLKTKRYVALDLPMSLGPTSALVLVPFDAAASENSKASNRYAVVAVKDAQATIGIVRYEVAKADLQYLATAGWPGLTEAEFWCWYIHKTDVVGAPSETRMEFETTDGRTRYYARLNKRQWALIVSTPKPTSVFGLRLAAIKAKFEEQQSKRKGETYVP